jgi:phosphoribosylformimino-5-aminoimidazole carboxamide ribotide isomerase
VIVIPTAELRGSQVYAPATRVPVDAAGTHRAFATLGFKQMHLHDLDADSGRDLNEALIAEIVRDSSIEVLLSGGGLSEDLVERLIDAGVAQVILGPGPDVDIDTLARLADSFPGRLIVRADLGDPLFSRRSGRRPSPTEMIDLANELDSSQIGGFAVHGVSGDGFPGNHLRFVEDLVEVASVPVYYRTEASTIGELRALEHLGIAATMLGSSLFNGQLDAQAIAHHFDS